MSITVYGKRVLAGVIRLRALMGRSARAPWARPCESAWEPLVREDGVTTEAEVGGARSQDGGQGHKGESSLPWSPQKKAALPTLCTSELRG